MGRPVVCEQNPTRACRETGCKLDDRWVLHLRPEHLNGWRANAPMLGRRLRRHDERANSFDLIASGSESLSERHQNDDVSPEHHCAGRRGRRALDRSCGVQRFRHGHRRDHEHRASHRDRRRRPRSRSSRRRSARRTDRFRPSSTRSSSRTKPTSDEVLRDPPAAVVRPALASSRDERRPPWRLSCFVNSRIAGHRSATWPSAAMGRRATSPLLPQGASSPSNQLAHCSKWSR